MESSDQIHCPKCNSTQLSANKRGFSGRKAFTGALLFGGIGLLAGTIASNDIVITCLNCGKEFNPGDGVSAISSKEVKPVLKWTNIQDDQVTIRELNKHKVAYKILLIMFAVATGLGALISALSGSVIWTIVLFLLAVLFIWLSTSKNLSTKNTKAY